MSKRDYPGYVDLTPEKRKAAEKFNPYEAAEPITTEIIRHLLLKYKIEEMDIDPSIHGRMITNIGLLICGAGVTFTPELIYAIAHRKKETKPIRDKHHYVLLRKALNELEAIMMAMEVTQ
jgi:hypothetical protein